MTDSIFICPVCGSPLSREDRLYRCGSSHTYDISKEGYVNLLLANQKHSREPGDSKEMLEARRSFLNKGYYKPLARSGASLIIKYRNRSIRMPGDVKMSYCTRRRLCTSTGSVTTAGADKRASSDIDMKSVNYSVVNNCQQLYDGPVFTILDAGCGEGYYTDYISKNRAISFSSRIYGVDISKDGIKSASKRSSTVSFAVAGIYNLPVADNSVDLILNIFAPFDETEFGRVLKDKGIIISVAPGANHLYEFKKHLYDEVYLNDEEFKLSDKFKITETVRVKYELIIHNKDDIGSLLKMTPYYHKSPPERIELFLKTVHELKTTADFVVRIISRT